MKAPVRGHDVEHIADLDVVVHMVGHQAAGHAFYAHAQQAAVAVVGRTLTNGIRTAHILSVQLKAKGYKLSGFKTVGLLQFIGHVQRQGHAVRGLRLNVGHAQWVELGCAGCAHGV